VSSDAWVFVCAHPAKLIVSVNMCCLPCAVTGRTHQLRVHCAVSISLLLRQCVGCYMLKACSHSFVIFAIFAGIRPSDTRGSSVRILWRGQSQRWLQQ